MHATRDLVAGKLRAAAREARFLPRAARLVRDAAGGWTLGWAALLALQGLAPVVVVWLSRPLVDAVAAAMRAQGAWDASQAALGFALAMGAALVVGELLRGACEWAGTVQAKRVEDHLGALIHSRSTTVDLAFYEWPEFHDHLHRARHEARHRPLALLESAGTLVQNAITLVAMAAMLVMFGWWMALALLVGALPAMLVVLRFAARHHAWRLEATPHERRTTYQDWLMTSGEAAAELRLFGLGAPLRAAWTALRARLRGEELRLAAAQQRAELAAALFAMLVAGACLAWVLWQAVVGAIGLGDAALFYAAFGHGQRVLRGGLAAVGRMYQNVLFLGNLFAFLDLEPRVREPERPRAAPDPAAGSRGLEVRFERVDFRYAGAERAALEEFDAAFRPASIAAIVGPNGAGKSTLVKLACRFYDPGAGRVTLGGVDVRELAASELRSRVTVLFQDPVRYDATVVENIAVGDPAPQMSDVKAAARAAGADEIVARLPGGYESLLGRWFEGGVELSVGEWQRIALARAFYRPAPVILLDEPTSAMDPWAEADWLRRFRALAAGRTAVLVTHRLTTAMQADVVHVMDGGRIVESGSHAELLRRGGLYARSWHSQMPAEAGAAQ